MQDLQEQLRWFDELARALQRGDSEKRPSFPELLEDYCEFFGQEPTEEVAKELESLLATMKILHLN